MKLKNLILLFLTLIIWSCSSEYGNEEIINDILDNNSGRIIKNYYKKQNLEKEDFKNVVEAYSKYLSNSKYKRIEYNDKFSFKERKRQGYIFLNEDNNFIASITFNYIMLQDSTHEINFIDFRNSTNELPCIKFPSKFPIKCLALPMSAPPNFDSLKNEYPKMIENRKFYHTSLISKKHLEAEGDSLKRVISFNTGNGIIGKNLSKILDEIDNQLGLQNYTLCESNQIGEPTINLSYDPEVHKDYEISELKSILELTTKSSVRLREQKTFRTSWGYSEAIISIGFPLSEAQVKIF